MKNFSITLTQILFFMLFGLNCQSQSSIAKIIGSPAPESVSRISNMSDGSFIIASGDGLDGYLIKLSADMDVEWSKTYGGLGSDSFSEAVELPSGDIIAVGTTHSYGAGSSDYWVVKVNSTGTLIWSKTFGTSGNDNANSVDTTSDGNIVICGQATPGPGGFANWVLKLNTDGSLLWNVAVGGGGFDFGAKVRTVSDGNIVMAGMIWGQGPGLDDGSLTKMNLSGGVLWKKYYGNGGNDGFYDFVEQADGSFVMTGYHGGWANAGWVVKTDATGNLDWSKTYDGPGNTVSQRIISLADGDILVSGYAQDVGAGGSDGFILKIDDSGDSLWTTLIGDVLNEGGFNLIEDSEDEAWAIGSINGVGFGSNDILLFNPDSLGNGPGCYQSDWAPTIETISLSTGTAGTTGSGGSSTSQVPTVTDLILNDSLLCYTCIMSSSAEVTTDYNGSDISCFGESDGEVAVTVINGSGEETYNWSSGGTSISESSLPSGTYFVVVTDGACVDTSYVTLTDPVLLTVSGLITSDYTGQDISCFGICDGEVTLTGSGGTGALIGDGIHTGICAGSNDYTINDTNGCTALTTVVLTEPTELIVSISSSVDVTCYDDCDGEAIATETGGTPTYAYLWDDPSAQTTATSSGLCIGDFIVTVTDANGCTDWVMVNISGPSPIDTNVTETYPTFTANATGVTYQWYDCVNNEIIIGETNQDFTPILNGDYAVIITDGPCIDTSYCHLIDGLTVNGTYEEKQALLEVYPNPSNGDFIIVSLSFETKMLRVLDQLGQEVGRFEITQGKNELSLDIVPGLYYLSSTDNEQAIKLIIN